MSDRCVPNEGELVKPGQVLMRMDTTKFSAH